MNDRTWISTKQAAEWLGINTTLLYEYIDRGRLPAYRFGRVIRLRRSDVETFLEGRQVEPGTITHLVDGTARSTRSSGRYNR